MSDRFHSILFPSSQRPTARDAREQPSFFHDLNLNQVVESITAAFKDYELAPFFLAGPLDLETIAYRQEVMHELERDAVMQGIAVFSDRMRAMRLRLAQAAQTRHRYEKERWLLGAAHAYCDAVAQLDVALRAHELRSRGLAALREYLAAYVASSAFRSFTEETTALLHDLSAIRYGLRIRDNSVTVLPYGGESDYTAVVEQAFEKFRRGSAKDSPRKLIDAGRLNHVETQVLDRVARLNPAVFAALDAFCTRHASYQDETVMRFDREIQFYVAYLGYIDRLRRTGLNFCYPRLSGTSKEVSAHDTFDLALASKLLSENAVVVRNDFALRTPERVLVVSGPNQGGKTTFARMFGQLHYLASLGCPVPGTAAQLFLFDRLFVHFERAEDIGTLRGRLQDDLVRIHHTLEQATPNSIIIMNELFASTTFHDAVYLTRKVMAAISRLDLLALCVTFLDDLATFDEKTVSLVGAVDPADPTVRTFRIERRPADGLAYAFALAEKHHVTYDWLKRRLEE